MECELYGNWAFGPDSRHYVDYVFEYYRRHSTEFLIDWLQTQKILDIATVLTGQKPELTQEIKAKELFLKYERGVDTDGL